MHPIQIYNTIELNPLSVNSESVTYKSETRDAISRMSALPETKINLKISYH